MAILVGTMPGASSVMISSTGSKSSWIGRCWGIQKISLQNTFCPSLVLLRFQASRQNFVIPRNSLAEMIHTRRSNVLFKAASITLPCCCVRGVMLIVMCCSLFFAIVTFPSAIAGICADWNVVANAGLFGCLELDSWDDMLGGTGPRLVDGTCWSTSYRFAG